jgi:hypothetical protein
MMAQNGASTLIVSRDEQRLISRTCQELRSVVTAASTICAIAALGELLALLPEAL